MRSERARVAEAGLTLTLAESDCNSMSIACFACSRDVSKHVGGHRYLKG